MKRKTGIATLLLLGAMPLAAFAADPMTPATGASQTQAAPAAKDSSVPSLFQQLDVNHDGFISRDEAKRSADVTSRFDKLDANHDGKISVPEYIKGMQGQS